MKPLPEQNEKLRPLNAHLLIMLTDGFHFAGQSSAAEHECDFM